MIRLRDVARGALIGITNIIPGLSGGTMLVIFGIYDKMIFALAGFHKNWRKSLKILLPFLLGAIIGVLGFARIIELLLSNFALPTCLAFTGLILGGVPKIWEDYKKSIYPKKKPFARHVLIFTFLFIVPAVLALIGGGKESTAELHADSDTLLSLLFLGALASAAMVVPGISGSMMLMLFGYYYRIIGSINRLVEAVGNMDLNAVIEAVIPLLIFGVGILIGIFLITKFIRYVLLKHGAAAYSGILGLVLASPIAMLHNTNALGYLAKPDAAPQVILGFTLMACCFGIVFILGNRSENKIKS